MKVNYMLSYLTRERKIGKLFNIPIKINGSFLLLLLLGSVASLFYGSETIVMLLILFGSVLIHEFGHIFAAKRYGIRTADVLLHFLGGAARMELSFKSGTEEAVMAVAGPIVSLCLGFIGLLSMMVFISVGAPAFVITFFHMFTTANFIIGIFNLLPAFPMDGGRILHGVLWNFQGIRKATNTVILVAKIFAIIFLLLGIFTFTPSMLLLAWFIWNAGSQERDMIFRKFT